MSYMSDKYESFECGCVRVRKCQEHDVTALQRELAECRSLMADMVRAFEILEPIEIVNSAVLNRMKAALGKGAGSAIS